MKKVWLLIAIFAFGILGAHAQSAASAGVPSLTGAEYAKSSSEDIHVMLVGFKGCGPCSLAEKLVLKPLLERFANEVHVKVVKVDTTQDEAASAANQQIKTLFQVQKFPTILVVYRKGAMWQKEGFSMSQAKSTIDAIVSAVSKLK